MKSIRNGFAIIALLGYSKGVNVVLISNQLLFIFFLSSVYFVSQSCQLRRVCTNILLIK